MPVCTPLGQGLSAQLLVEEGIGKPPHHHPSSHFPSLDDTGVSPLSVITNLPYDRALIIIICIRQCANIIKLKLNLWFDLLINPNIVAKFFGQAFFYQTSCEAFFV